MAIYRKPISKTATILNTATDSDEIHLRDYVLAAIITPSTLTSASFSFKVAAAPGGTFVPLVDTAGALLTATMNVDTAIAIHGTIGEALAACQFIKIVAAGAELQDDVFTLLLK